MQLRIFPLGSFPLFRIHRTPEQCGVGDGTVSDGIFGSLVGSAVPRYKRPCLLGSYLVPKLACRSETKGVLPHLLLARGIGLTTWPTAKVGIPCHYARRDIGISRRLPDNQA
jgi:hypothetical protein